MTFTNSRKPNDDREVNLKMSFLTRVYIKKQALHYRVHCLLLTDL